MLYKYLFYSVSFIVKKYDRFWRVGDTYYIGGGMAIGMVASLTIINILDIAGALIINEMLLVRYPFLTYLPLILGVLVTFYLGYRKRHLSIYKEIEHLHKIKKRTYKILNIIHIILVFTIFFNMKQILLFLGLIGN